MKQFDLLYEEIIKSLTTYDALEFNEMSYNELLKLDYLILEEKSVLTKPEKLFYKVKSIIEKLIKNNDHNPVKVKIYEAISDDYCKQFEDDGLYQELIKLFHNHKDAYFYICVPEIQLPHSYGKFEFPSMFKGFDDECYSIYNLPKIQSIPGIVNKRSEDFIKKHNELVKLEQDHLKNLQEALKLFKKSIFNSEDEYFGTININYESIINDNESLDDTICHELQHFLIFLLSIAKTSITFGMFFCNEIEKVREYTMKPTEFFTLSRSYIKKLHRIYLKVKDKFSIPFFINEFLRKSLYNKEINKEINNELENDVNIKKIFAFYHAAFNDQNYGIETGKDYFNKETMKMESIRATKPMKIKRYNTLLRWTINIFQDLEGEKQ